MKNIIQSFLTIALISFASCSVASGDAITAYLSTYPLGVDPHPEQTEMVQKMSRAIAAKERIQADVPGMPNTKGVLIGHIIRELIGDRMLSLMDPGPVFHQSAHSLFALACDGWESARDCIATGFARGKYGIVQDFSALRILAELGVGYARIYRTAGFEQGEYGFEKDLSKLREEADSGSEHARMVILADLLHRRDKESLVNLLEAGWEAAREYLNLFRSSRLDFNGDPVFEGGLRLTPEGIPMRVIGPCRVDGALTIGRDTWISANAIEVNIFKEIPGRIDALGFPPEIALVRLPDINDMGFVRWFASKPTLEEKHEILTRFILRFDWIRIGVQVALP